MKLRKTHQNKKAQIPPPILGIIVLFIFLVMVFPLLTETFNSISCKREKGTIADIQNQLNQCRNQLSNEAQKAVSAQLSFNDCQKKLTNCTEELDNCIAAYWKLKKECDAKDQPITEYYFIKVFSNKLILFEWFILYHIHLFGLFFTVGLTFSIKFFEIDIEIKVLNKKNQRKLVKSLREYLIEHPYHPILILIIIIIITNLPKLIQLL